MGIPVELCLSSNASTNQLYSVIELMPHLKHLNRLNHNVIICVDDTCN